MGDIGSVVGDVSGIGAVGEVSDVGFGVGNIGSVVGNISDVVGDVGDMGDVVLRSKWRLPKRIANVSSFLFK